MRIKWDQIIGIGFFVAGWLRRATVLKPGETRPVITPEEQAELGREVVSMLAEMIDEDIEI